MARNSHKRPRVTVVVPNFNHERFIEAALDSILNQTSAVDEIIVIDDGSTDNSVTLISRKISGIPYAKLIRHKSNLGVIATLNEGLGQARHPYICFPGSDDLVLPRAFETALGLLANHPEAGFCSGRTETIDINGGNRKQFPTHDVLRSAGYLNPDSVKAALIADDTWILGLTFYNTTLLRQIGGFREELRGFADGFASRLLALQHGCCFIPDSLNLWRRDTISISSTDIANLDRAKKIAETASKLMQETYRADFPARYTHLWNMRWRFAAYSQYVTRTHRLFWDKHFGVYSNALSINTLLRGFIESYLLLIKCLLFVKYRPNDIFNVLRRRLLKQIFPILKKL